MSDNHKTKFETVMIIDDNNIDLYISSRLIIKNFFGSKVLEYSNAQEALNYIVENQNDISILPQIIFVDIYMPMMSGFQFLDEYEKLPQEVKNNCKVYIISTTIDEDDIVRSRRDKNVISFHVKPINKEFLHRIPAE